jgi:hypothetical protein
MADITLLIRDVQLGYTDTVFGGEKTRVSINGIVRSAYNGRDARLEAWSLALEYYSTHNAQVTPNETWTTHRLPFESMDFFLFSDHRCWPEIRPEVNCEFFILETGTSLSNTIVSQHYRYCRTLARLTVYATFNGTKKEFVSDWITIPGQICP